MNKSFRLVVCCLNISEGRNKEIVEKIAYAAISQQSTWTPYKFDHEIKYGLKEDDIHFKSKASVVSVYSDETFNRGNITIVAPVIYIANAIYQACNQAFQNISLSTHLSPNHPRLGVCDLVPIHPVSKTVSLTECGLIAKQVGKMLNEKYPELGIIYYGSADESNRTLVERRKGINWYNSSNYTQVKPDLGEFNSSFGIIVIGGAPYMSVLNVMLDTSDLKLGKRIASTLRQSNNGLPGIHTMAFYKENKKVEIACNIDTNDLQTELPVFKTSIEELENHIKQLAGESDVSILGQSLRGFTPKEAYDIGCHALLNGISVSWKERSQKMMFLANEHLVERLANSFVIRRLAQLTHYSYLKITQAGERSLDKFSSKHEATKGNNLPQGTFVFSRFLRRFLENMRKEIEKSNMK